MDVAQTNAPTGNALGIIIARGGSVGLPHKHLRLLLDREVIQYSFDHAADASLTDVAVSSDIDQVLQMAVARRFIAVKRPAHLSSDTATVQDALLHALESAERQSGRTYQHIALLYGNIPLRPEGLVDRAIGLLEQTDCDSVRSFCPVGKWHPHWMSKLNGDVVEPLVPGSIHRRQDLPPLYLHDGGIVAVSRTSLMRGKHDPSDPHAFFGVDRRAVVTQPHDVVEIDRELDLYLAEAILRCRRDGHATHPKRAAVS